MKKLPDGSYRFSPRDLISYLEGDFTAWCDRLYAERGTAAGARGSESNFAPDETDDEMQLVIRKGFEHESAYVEQLQKLEPDLVVIERDETGGDAAARATSLAMDAGAPIIIQAELRTREWLGIADVLHRRDGNSALGTYFYEPWDTKLARSAKPSYLIQLCAYAEMLEALQEHRPDQFGFVLGDGNQASFETKELWDYYQRLKKSFVDFHDTWSEDDQPDPALERSVGRWNGFAERLLTERDDLTLIANITRSQVIRLRDGGIHTLTQLATHEGALPKAISAATFGNLRAQAAMQLETRHAGTIQWKFRAPNPDMPRRGLALLPPASVNDIFFDLEGFPYAPKGLEYLFGVVTVDGGHPEFHDWWAHDEIEERRSFESFVDWAYARWTSDPTLHIYHYAAYEKSALCRLMSRYGSREREVDDLLRNNVLVDLYAVVLQAMVIGTPGYSLKDIEHLYMPMRSKAGVATAGGSVVAYQWWIDSGEPPKPSESPLLNEIREYNKVDCESTLFLRDWLLERQKEAGIAWLPAELPKPDAGEASEAELLSGSLLARADELPAGEDQRVTRLMAWLLEYHRREEKPFWWKHFDLLNAPEQKLFDDHESLAGLVRTATPATKIKKSSGLEYRFDPNQETKLRAECDCELAGTDRLKCTLERFIDRDAGLVELKVGPGKTLPDHVSLIPGPPISTASLRDGILRFVQKWAAGDRTHRALEDLLHRRAPRLSGAPNTLSIDNSKPLAAQTIDTIERLDESTLCIQGPPGTGKTSIAADVIIALLNGGKRVGIVANGHDVILNLMDRVACCAEEAGTHPRLVKVKGDADHPLIASGRIERIESKEAKDIIAECPLVIGGTAWLFARADLEGALDYLFIEEAGQFSLANAVAVGSSACNIVLLGDQMQLSQPVQGSHPGESGQSALTYLIEDSPTVPPDLGIFLGTSYRMHPDVCSLISSSYYDRRLTSAPGTREHRIVGGLATSIGMEAGVAFVPVEHEGCTQESEEEVCEIEKLVKELLGCAVVVKSRPERAMTLRDILIVAPFNMQVRALKQKLGVHARVGTVDKFQGQEAPVVIVSMCASTIQDAPRGPAFLLEKNRLNVAISRAQALAVVVASAELGSARARSVEEIYLLNGWCRIEMR